MLQPEQGSDLLTARKLPQITHRRQMFEVLVPNDQVSVLSWLSL